MSMKQAIVLTMLILSACTLENIESQVQIIEPYTTSRQVSVAPENIRAEFLISDNGIGNAKLGMTLGELKQISDRDTRFELMSPFTIDSNAIAVSKGGIVQYYILYKTDNLSTSEKFAPTDKEPITSLMTDNYNYQTLEGVKVGTSIQEAEEIYGDAILAYNQEGESKEYITFENRSESNVSFRASYYKLISDGLGFSGIYPEYPGVSYTTDKYQTDAAIAAIEVSCIQDSCPN